MSAEEAAGRGSRPAGKRERRARPPRSAVRAAVRSALTDLVPGDRALVALSGGPDSLALCAAAGRVGAELGLLVSAVVIDHQLQEGSGDVAATAAQQAVLLGVDDARVVAVRVASGPGRGGLEAAARTARYEALRQAAAHAGACCVLLGHTRDDQAETVLLGLARGSGIRSLAGMAARSGLWRRPLLGLPREVVAAAAAAAAQEDPRLAPWTDPHNADPRYLRVRARREILPQLRDVLGPGVSAALARTADLARADADALQEWADRVLADSVDHEDQGVLATVGLREQPSAIRTRVLRGFLIRHGCPADEVTAELVWELERRVLPTSRRLGDLALPGGRQARFDPAGGTMRVFSGGRPARRN